MSNILGEKQPWNWGKMGILPEARDRLRRSCTPRTRCTAASSTASAWGARNFWVSLRSARSPHSSLLASSCASSASGSAARRAHVRAHVRCPQRAQRPPPSAHWPWCLDMLLCCAITVHGTRILDRAERDITLKYGIGNCTEAR